MFFVDEDLSADGRIFAAVHADRVVEEAQVAEGDDGEALGGWEWSSR